MPGLTNGTHADSTSATADDELRPLKVVIVGGGIGGLSAAIGLRQAGHQVTVLEQWDGANETGAAIHLAPNCNGILRRFGLKPENFGANTMNHMTEYAIDGSQIRSVDLTEPNKQWQHPWQLVHRVHLHSELRKVAVAPEGKGTPADMRYSSRVTHVDPANASVTLANGEVVHGDVVVGADGVYSTTRQLVKGGHIKPYSSGKSAFRFLVNKQEAFNNPATRKFVERDGELVMWLGPHSKIVAYPCQNNELLNFVCIHPSDQTAAPSDEWSSGGSKKALLDVYAEYDESARALLDIADPKTIKLWQLLDMQKLPTWLNDKFALLGDAAHPFLPHQGQGGGQAIEDAAALTVVLPLGTRPDEVSERLEVYETCRYERAHRIQEYTRMAGKCLAEEGTVDSE